MPLKDSALASSANREGQSPCCNSFHLNPFNQKEKGKMQMYCGPLALLKFHLDYTATGRGSAKKPCDLPGGLVI